MLRSPARAETPIMVNVEVSMSVGGVWATGVRGGLPGRRMQSRFSVD
jgi:hypothetical protein